MNKKNIKLFSVVLAVIAVISLFLWREIVNFRSITTKTASEPLLSDRAVPIEISPEDQILGNPGAPKTIVEFIDLNDLKSRQLHKTFSEFTKNNPQKIRLIFKHAPVAGFFGDNTLANRSAYCAGKFGKLWQFLDALGENKPKESVLRGAATTIGLPSNEWWQCVNGEKSLLAIQKDLTVAQSLQFGKPPLIFINNKKLSTDLDYDLGDLLKTLISE